VRVDVEFLAPSDVKLKRNRPKLIGGFRVLQVPACSVAFARSQDISIEGVMMSGAANTVCVRVASVPDFIIMKAHALEGRDKPKDVYDICFCLDHYPGGIAAVADNWRSRRGERLVDTAVRILSEKFETVEHYGPRQLAVFHDSTDAEERAMQARRAFELVQRLLNLL
jgi:predicted nucleotidyltransferase